ncbi:hypothetical protein K501DRAFT_337828 [Backusella circina FSU 941]|nr:hypothetical protein K501DRAFT_337828 [Backusella circina FSU 941]
MNYTFNSSDILFPEDTDIPKLTSPMYTKVPEGIDWASQDLMDTFNDKTSQELAHILSLKRRIRISDNDNDDDNFGPLKTCKPHSDEKKLCQALSSIYHPLDQKEIHEIIRDVFEMVQNDIQKNNQGYPPYFAEPFLSWKDEIWQDGNVIGSIGNISDFEPKLNHNSPSPQQDYYYHNHTTTLEQPSMAGISNHLVIEKNNSLPAKEKKQLSKLASYFKNPKTKKSFKSFYKKAKKNIKAITFKVLHV